MMFPPAPEPAEEFDESPEVQAVYDWRFAVLFEAGYDSRLAEHFALTTIDLHKLALVKQNGATDAQALRIFT